MAQRPHDINQCTWVEVKEWLKETDIVLVPLGSAEQHGPHCPMGTDSYLLTMLIRSACEGAKVPHAPFFYYGYTPYHLLPKEERRPGTITLSFRNYFGAVYDICRSLIHNGFNKIILVTGHTGNFPVLDVVARQVRYDTGAMVVQFRGDSEAFPGLPQMKPILESTPEEVPGSHASEIECSGVLAYDESLVRWERAKRLLPQRPSWAPEGLEKRSGSSFEMFFQEMCVRFPLDHQEFSTQGVLGNALLSSKEKGERIYQTISRILIGFIEEMKKIPVKVENRKFTERAY